MNLQEIKSVREESGLPHEIRQLSFWKGRIFINNKTVLPVDYVSNGFDKTRDIAIKKASGEEIGVLTFTRDNKNLLDSSGRILIGALNEDQFIAYLVESNAGLSYPNFLSNHVVLKRAFVEDYVRLLADTAPIWGSYSHPISGTTLNQTYQSVAQEVVATAGLRIPKKYYLNTCIRAIQQPFAFERFLKFYHLLELSFDSLIVEKIKKLDLINDPNKIGKLLNEYDQKEIKRLIYVLKEKCNSPAKLVPLLDTLKAHEPIALNLLYKFGNEESNPIKKESVYLNLTTNLSFGNQQDLKDNGINISPDRDLNTFLVQFVAYIIYRIRNSVAHSKIGEFIFQPTDEQFILDFAEPLIIEVLKQVFRK